MMNHLQKYQFEKFVPPAHMHWVAWAAMVEHFLGHSLDGSLEKDGFSLDRAYSAFDLGATHIEYAESVLKMPQYKRNKP